MPFERYSTILELNREVNNWNVFHSHNYIHRVWGELSKIERIIPQAHGYQAAVIIENIKPGILQRLLNYLKIKYNSTRYYLDN
jgi:hypothetical protein